MTSTVEQSSQAIESERASLYAMFGDLLCQPPESTAIAAAISALETGRPPPELASARALLIRALWIAREVDTEEEYGQVFAQPLDCCTEHATTHVAKVPRSIEDRIRHLLHLAMHADRYVQAMTENQLGVAQQAWTDGRDLLDGHEGSCLYNFALWMQGSHGRYFFALGTALRELVERDLSSRRAPGIPARRWLALTLHKIQDRGGRRTLQTLVNCPQQLGELVALDSCMECGRWDGIQFGSKEQRSMILCRVDDVCFA